MRSISFVEARGRLREMSEFAAGFRTQDLRTALQVRHTIFTLRKRKKIADSYTTVSKKGGYFTVFHDHAWGNEGGGGDGRIPFYTGWKQETKANVSFQRKYPQKNIMICRCVSGSAERSVGMKGAGMGVLLCMSDS